MAIVAVHTIDASQRIFSETLFIESYREALKLAPARFLTLRVHPDTAKMIEGFAQIPESIQWGAIKGALGKTAIKVACVKPTSGVQQGITVVPDLKIPVTTLLYELHGQSMLSVENFQTKKV